MLRQRGLLKFLASATDERCLRASFWHAGGMSVPNLEAVMLHFLRQVAEGPKREVPNGTRLLIRPSRFHCNTLGSPGSRSSIMRPATSNCIGADRRCCVTV